MKELYEKIQIELDKHRVDEWHSVIPLSEDGACLVDDLAEVGHPSLVSGVNGLTLHDTMSIQPKNAYTSRAYSILYEDADYIYNILTVESGDPHAGHLAQITRHDKERESQWEYEDKIV
jgi:hypothetical protein|tara:strand:+ start:378 stop:734 length:357 start_codon:yes stop_codon:yes gene_type:complete